MSRRSLHHNYSRESYNFFRTICLATESDSRSTGVRYLCSVHQRYRSIDFHFLDLLNPRIYNFEAQYGEKLRKLKTSNTRTLIILPKTHAPHRKLTNQPYENHLRRFARRNKHPPPSSPTISSSRIASGRWQHREFGQPLVDAENAHRGLQLYQTHWQVSRYGLPSGSAGCPAKPQTISVSSPGYYSLDRS